MPDLQRILDWTASLPPGTATFLGSLAGASLGLLAVLIGALLNAQLNRNRDGRVRSADRRGLAAALQAELIVMRTSMLGNATEAEHLKRQGDDLIAPDPIQLVRVYPAVAGDLGRLPAATIAKVVTAYGVLPHYVDQLISVGGEMQHPRTAHDERRLIVVPAKRKPHFAAICRGVADAMSTAIEALDEEIRRR